MYPNKNLKDYFDSIESPAEFKKYINSGIEKAKRDEMCSKTKNFFKISGMVAACLILTTIFFYNISPAFAGHINKLSVSKHIAAVFKGFNFKTVSENKYTIALNQSQGNEDVTLQLNEYFATKNRIYIDYELLCDSNASKDINYILSPKYKLKQKGSQYDTHMICEKTLSCTYEDGILKNYNHLLVLTVPEKISINYPIELIASLEKGYNSAEYTKPLDSSVVLDSLSFDLPPIGDYEKNYPINKKYSVDGYDVEVDALSINPINAVLTVKEYFQTGSSPSIININTATLQDSSGEIWSERKIFAHNYEDVLNSDAPYRLHEFFIDTPYHDEYANLKLRGLSFEVLPEELKYFNIDLKTHEISPPYNEYLSVLSIKEKKEHLDIRLKNKLFRTDGYDTLNIFPCVSKNAQGEVSCYTDSSPGSSPFSYILRVPKSSVGDTLKCEVLSGSNKYLIIPDLIELN